MLVAMAEDLRVVFIKLADRLNNMQTLYYLSLTKQRSIALETAEIYAPLAHRLGIWELKWQLEDLSFRHLKPKKYHKISILLDRKNKYKQASDFSYTLFNLTGETPQLTNTIRRMPKPPLKNWIIFIHRIEQLIEIYENPSIT